MSQILRIDIEHKGLTLAKNVPRMHSFKKVGYLFVPLNIQIAISLRKYFEFHRKIYLSSTTTQDLKRDKEYQKKS